MADNKTHSTDASVDNYLEAIVDKARRADCRALLAMMRDVTGHPPRMWGASIVGFDSYHYRYDSGREGDSCVTGFASRKGDISIYLVASGSHQVALLRSLGKHKMGKACLYLKRLSDLDPQLLRQLLVESVAEVKRRYG